MIRAAKAALALALFAVIAACQADPPGPTPLPTPLPSLSAAAPGLVLAPATYRIAPMPVTPTWRPDGERVQPSFVGNRWMLAYAKAKLTLIVTYDSPDSYEIRPEGEGSPVTMLGLPGRLYHGTFGDSPEHTLIVATDANGLSVMAYGYAQDVVRRFATGLRWQPMPILAPFEVGLLPERFVPVRISSYTMEFATDAELGGAFVAIGLRGDLESDPTAIPTTVGGHPAQYRITEEQAYIWVFLDSDRTVKVDVAPPLGVDRDLLERLAAGVRVTEHATVFSNP